MWQGLCFFVHFLILFLFWKFMQSQKNDYRHHAAVNLTFYQWCSCRMIRKRSTVFRRQGLQQSKELVQQYFLDFQIERTVKKWILLSCGRHVSFMEDYSPCRMITVLILKSNSNQKWENGVPLTSGGEFSEGRCWTM